MKTSDEFFSLFMGEGLFPSIFLTHLVRGSIPLYFPRPLGKRMYSSLFSSSLGGEHLFPSIFLAPWGEYLFHFISLSPWRRVSIPLYFPLPLGERIKVRGAFFCSPSVIFSSRQTDLPENPEHGIMKQRHRFNNFYQTGQNKIWQSLKIATIYKQFPA